MEKLKNYDVLEMNMGEMKSAEGGILYASLLLVSASAWALLGSGLYAGWNAYE